MYHSCVCVADEAWYVYFLYVTNGTHADHALKQAVQHVTLKVCLRAIMAHGVHRKQQAVPKQRRSHESKAARP